ncbi:hypothetical protein [Brumimicrobium mesophilum]|uniref:hypothetical protein n=1 Tax=Brumimicrobium mesophilum TaxID=392717 RepID=UPI000D140C56|nr:hypothetical protein [Brumimicrobium mesophilum]
MDNKIPSFVSDSEYGTYYYERDNNDELVVKQQKVNLMLNLFYGRLVRNRILLGVDFSYQKHHITAFEHELNPEYDIVNPVYNIIEIQGSFGIFLGQSIAPNKHLLQFQYGPRLFFIKNNYNSDDGNSETELDQLYTTVDYKIPMHFMRFSVNYTYRQMLTENLNLDLGVTTNFGIYSTFLDPYSPFYYDYYTGSINFLTYSPSYMKSRLARETMRNILYFKVGLSYNF